ncbi:ArnT family glycosyltransferase [Shewanella sp. cp20]|uniref:ArnT family glycosyltransferase n=1 Tax=Shewanella sp. cp20 TaxID=1521167 RepID=UPI0005A113A1|nr:glycosyltransferase family 39 protein [Shewanella sp. cp20]KIO36732.1 membrane protein [Shewanella sp. cp20]
METTDRIGKSNHSKSDIFPHSALTLGAVLFFAIAARFYVAFRYEINWDEFYFLSFVHQFINGETISGIQTFHIHFFTWIRYVSNNEVDQIIAARLVMIAFQMGTGLCIYRLCRLQCSVSGALFAVLSYFAFSFNVRMGASFRTDSIATFLIMLSLYYVFSNQLSWRSSVAAGVFTSVALLITLKASLYIPTFLAMVLVSFYWAEDRMGYAKQILIYGCSILVSFAILYSWHSFTISGVSGGTNAGAMLDAADKTLSQRQLFPRWHYFQYSLTTDFGYWFTLALGIGFVVFSYFKQTQFSREMSLKLFGISLPLVTLLFYRNAFPYYYTFMLASVSVLSAVAWDGARGYLNHRLCRFIFFILASLFTVSIVVNGLVLPTKRSLNYQRQFIDEVHKVFPEPVAYIDCCSMVSRYSKQGFFMSTWGYEDYYTRGVPVIQSAIEKNTPVFVIANSHYLNALKGVNSNDGLLDQDTKALKSNYIHHWAELYVAGKVLKFAKGDKEQEIQISIEGEYTLEGSFDVGIDGHTWKSGQVRFLSKGSYLMSATDVGEVVIRWGNHLYRPEALMQSQALFTGF